MEPYLGQIILFAGPYAPENWAYCDGSLLSIGTYDALYSLIGTTYGGDGVNNFALPDLRGRIPVSQGQRPNALNYVLAQKAGAVSTALTTANLPAHTHALNSTATPASANSPQNGMLASTRNNSAFYLNVPAGAAETKFPLSTAAVQATGGGQTIDQRMPEMGMNYIICVLGGIYPTRP